MELEKLINKQRLVEHSLGHPMGAGENATKECMLALIVEATEVLNEINWKPWKQLNRRTVDQTKLRGELADCFLFWALAVNSAEIDPRDMALTIAQKQAEAYPRHRGPGVSANKNNLCEHKNN